MNQEGKRLVIQVVRFGLPLTVFTVTASRNFGYRPETTLKYEEDQSS